jgi:hypothetical protein
MPRKLGVYLIFSTCIIKGLIQGSQKIEILDFSQKPGSFLVLIDQLIVKTTKMHHGELTVISEWFFKYLG